MKTRGYVAIGAGILLVVLMAAIWLVVGSSMAGNTNLGQAQLVLVEGKLAMGFVAMIVAGVLAIANGTVQITKGKPNVVLWGAMVALFISGSIILYQAVPA